MAPERGPRILLVCSHYGVDNHTGGFRWTSMVRHLVELGYSFDVLTLVDAEPDACGLYAEEAGGRVRIHAIPGAWWGSRARGLVRRLVDRARGSRRGEAPRPPRPRTAPDPEAIGVWRPGERYPWRDRPRRLLVGATEVMRDLAWVRKAAAYGESLTTSTTFGAVVVSSPLQLAHLAGARIADRAGLPYVADLRDPFYFGRAALNGYLDGATRLAWRTAECRSMRSAAAVVDLCGPARRAALRDLPASVPRAPRHVIPNGHDPLPAVERPDPHCFQVVYTGWLYPFMDVRVLLAACARFRERHRLAPDRFRLTLAGTAEDFNGVPLAELAGAYGLGAHFRWTPRLPRAEATRLQQAAAVLVGFDYPLGIWVPSKLYHYARMYGSLLLIGNRDGGMAEQAARIGVPMHAPGEAGAIDRFLDQAYARWLAGAYEHPLDRDGILDNRHRSLEMHRVLSGVMDGAPTDAAGAPVGAER